MIISFSIILVLGFLLGEIASKLNVPRLIGMLFAGILISPSVFNLLDTNTINISEELRKMILIIILLKAGLSLDFESLKKVGRPAFFLSFLPACFEIVAASVLTVLIFKIEFIQAILLATVIAAVSPAVVVPSMIKLIQEKWGDKKKIPHMILAGASLDDVFVIVVFSSVLKLNMGLSVDIMNFLQIPISILLGGVLAVILSKIILFIFKNYSLKVTHKLLVIITFSFSSYSIETILSDYIKISSLISVIVLGILLKENLKSDLSKELSNEISKIWDFAEIFLFTLVGAALNVGDLQDVFLGGTLLIFASLIIRSIGVYISIYKTKLNLREKAFVIGAYTPKATVQAALSTVALNLGISSGNLILSIAVLSIILTAPLGAFFIAKSHRVLLVKN